MILKYKANKKKFKKPIELSMKDVLTSDAKIFINNIQTISDKKIKQKQKNYVKPAGMYIPSKKDYLQFDPADDKLKLKEDNCKNQSMTIRVDNDKKKIDLWLGQIILDTIKNDFESFNKHLEDGWDQI